MSNPNQSSVDSVGLFHSDLSQAVIVLESTVECAVLWVQCMHVLAQTTKQTKQNKTKQDKTRQNKTKQTNKQTNSDTNNPVHSLPQQTLPKKVAALP